MLEFHRLLTSPHDSSHCSPNPAWNHRNRLSGCSQCSLYSARGVCFSPHTDCHFNNYPFSVWSSLTIRWFIISPKLGALLAQISKAIISSWHKTTAGCELNMALYSDSKNSIFEEKKKKKKISEYKNATPKKTKQKKNSKGLLDKSLCLLVSDCLQNCYGSSATDTKRLRLPEQKLHLCTTGCYSTISPRCVSFSHLSDNALIKIEWHQLKLDVAQGKED